MPTLAMEHFMRRTWILAISALTLWAMPVRAQQAGGQPVADALRFYLAQFSKNLVAAADDFPVSKYTYKPTAPQLSVAQIVEHLAGSNLLLCSSAGGVPAPAEPALAGTPDVTSPDTLKARLRRSFAFCEKAFASLDDSRLADSVPFFGGRKVTRAQVILGLPYDWADHYSQFANYLRLNAISPPNARARAVPVP